MEDDTTLVMGSEYEYQYEIVFTLHHGSRLQYAGNPSRLQDSTVRLETRPKLAENITTLGLVSLALSDSSLVPCTLVRQCYISLLAPEKGTFLAPNSEQCELVI